MCHEGHTIKPGTPEHGTPAERQSNVGTPRNNGGIPEHHRS